MLRRNICLLQQIISERTRLFEKGKSFTIKSPAANKVPNRIDRGVKKLTFFVKKCKKAQFCSAQ
jgi:hypothetical protein